jgi:hypothetical protein
MRGRAKTRIANVGLVVASVVLTLTVAELIFRAVPISSYELSAEAIWEAQSPGTDQDREFHEIGNLAFREGPLPAEIYSQETVRVLFLGDSFTRGAGIAEDGDRFTDIVESRLNAALRERGAPTRVHVFNAGQHGTEPEEWFEHLGILEPIYRPQLVFAVFCLRDGTRLSTSLKYNRVAIRVIKEPYERLPFHDSSRLMRFIYNRFAWREYSRALEAAVMASYVGSTEERAEWLKQSHFLLRMSGGCNEKGIPFSIVIFPLLFDLEDYPFHEVEEEIQGFARANGIPSHSLTPGFLGQDERRLWVASNDQHPNEEGHRIAAEGLLPVVELAVSSTMR